jgi:hypothetical protein
MSISKSLLSRLLPALLLAAPPLAGCDQGEDGLTPVGGDEVSVVQQTRFLRRLYLDLTGFLPSEAELSAGLDRLDREGTGPGTRGAIASELLADPRFADLFVSELENRVFGGGTAEDAYGLFCPVLKDLDPACAACAPTADCSGCPCATLTTLADERASILASAEDIASGQESLGAIERRYASSRIFTLNNGSPEGIADGLFENFLGRLPEPDEVANARAMVFGTFFPGSPVGLLFHRHGESYADLVDIVFTSEVYRDAAVDRVFLRYLGRYAAPAELAAFSQQLDPASPDVRPVILAVVSSGEYFSQ